MTRISAPLIGNVYYLPVLGGAGHCHLGNVTLDKALAQVGAKLDLEAATVGDDGVWGGHIEQETN